MANARIRITTDLSNAGLVGLLAGSQGRKREATQDVITFLRGLEGGMRAATLDVVVGTQGGAAASGTLTVASNSASSVSVNGVALTGGTDYVIAGQTAAQIAANIQAAIAASIDTRLLAVQASVAAAVITVSSYEMGLVGNNIALAATGAVTASAATLAGGAEPVIELYRFNR